MKRIRFVNGIVKTCGESATKQREREREKQNKTSNNNNNKNSFSDL